MKNRQEVEKRLAVFPIIQYEFLLTSELVFSEKVRYICRTECDCYGKSWFCPPAVGTVEECKVRSESYRQAFVFITAAEVQDAGNFEEALASKKNHEKIVRQVVELFRKTYGNCLGLSSGSCDLCETCAYPDFPCLHPEEMLPCIESYGILVPDIVEKFGLSYDQGSGMVTWFGLILFDKRNYQMAIRPILMKHPAGITRWPFGQY